MAQYFKRNYNLEILFILAMFSTECGLTMALHTSRQSRESTHLLSLITYTWMVAFRLHPSIPYVLFASFSTTPQSHPLPTGPTGTANTGTQGQELRSPDPTSPPDSSPRFPSFLFSSG